MTYPKATLGDLPLLASAPVRWTYTEGTAWHEETFDMIPADAEVLGKTNSPVTLKVDAGDRKFEVKQLWVLNVVPGDNPHIAKVRVADRRVWLPYFNFLGRFNMRRNVGMNRVGSNATVQLNPVVPDLWYWKWSLKTPPNTKWKASETVVEFMRQLEEWESTEGRPGGGYVIHGALKQLDTEITVDSLNIDDSGDMAMLRLLALYPNASVYVNKDGKYVFFDRNDGQEDVIVKKQMGPLIVGSGQFKKVSNALQRPQEVEVYFTAEVEVRHDYIRNLGTGTGDVRSLDNVAPVPDFQLTAGGVNYVQNSWINIPTMLASASWANHPGAGGGQITQTMLEKAAMPYLDLWGALLITGVRNPDADWSARIAVLQQHWRRTFRLKDWWMDHTLSLKARRCALIDPATGTWAPSEAFCNHSFLGTVRSFFKNRAESKGLEYAINVEGYPTGEQVPGISTPSGAKKFTDTSKAAPVVVKVIDGDQGVIELNFQAEPNHIHEAALPGRIVRADGSPYTPSADFSNPERSPVGFDLVTSRTQVPQLEADWKMAVILTHVPAAPNNKQQLYKITVKPKDVRGRLPPAARNGLDEAKGPTWQVRVGAGMDGVRALVRWADDRATDIEAIFGIGDKAPDFSGLVVNHDTGGSAKQPAISLQEFANGVAAQIYARFADHQEGSGEADVNTDVELGGWVASVTHALGTNGTITTAVTMKQMLADMNLYSLFDASTRAILMKLPHVDRQ